MIYLFFLQTSSARGGEGGRCQTFFFFFPCSADHERDWPPCKVVFFGLATIALNVRSNNNNSSMGNHTDFCIDLFAFTTRSPAWETAPISVSICSPSQFAHLHGKPHRFLWFAFTIRSPAWETTPISVSICSPSQFAHLHGKPHRFLYRSVCLHNSLTCMGNHRFLYG